MTERGQLLPRNGSFSPLLMLLLLFELLLALIVQGEEGSVSSCQTCCEEGA